MKRVKLIKELVKEGCYLKRHGKRHDIYSKPGTGKSAPIPRHKEIKNTLCALIKKQLGV